MSQAVAHSKIAGVQWVSIQIDVNRVALLATCPEHLSNVTNKIVNN